MRVDSSTRKRWRLWDAVRGTNRVQQSSCSPDADELAPPAKPGGLDEEQHSRRSSPRSEKNIAFIEIFCYNSIMP